MGEATLFERIVQGSLPSHPVARGQGWYAFLDVFLDGRGTPSSCPSEACPDWATSSPRSAGP